MEPAFPPSPPPLGVAWMAVRSGLYFVLGALIRVGESLCFYRARVSTMDLFGAHILVRSMQTNINKRALLCWYLGKVINFECGIILTSQFGQRC